MTDIANVRLSRRNLKGGLSRTLTSISKLLATGSAVDVQLLQDYVKKAEEQFQNIEIKHGEVVDRITDEEKYAEEEKWMANCEQTYLDNIMRARKAYEVRNPVEPPTLDLKSSTPPSSTPATDPDMEETASLNSAPPTARLTQPASPRGTMSASNQAHTSGFHTPKMTRMKFPTFSGAIEDYDRFKNLFKYCTQELNEMETFYQLTESMLNTKEKTMVKSCMNVVKAWEILDARYGDQDRLVDSLLNDLESLKTYDLKGKINVNAMTHFIQILQNFECRAEAMGLSGELNSKIMLSSIKQKLPEEHRMGYYKNVRDKGASDTLAGLTVWLREQLLLIEKCRTPNGNHEDAKSQNVKTSRSLHVSVKQSVTSGSKTSGKCPIHPGSSTHFLKTCNAFRRMSISDKHEMMGKHGICRRCGHDNCVAGKPPHDVNTCQFIRPCGIKACGQDSHFAAICPLVYGKDQERSAQQDSKKQQPRSLVTSVNTRSLDSGSGDEGKLRNVLPTVMGYLRRGNDRQLVRFLLDSGSQTTLLREGIFKKDGRDMYQDHDLILVGGNKIRRKLRILDCILEDITGNWSCQLTVTEIDKPCGKVPIVRMEDLQSYEHLSNVSVQATTSETIDVLLGVDNTHLMVWEEYSQGENPEDPLAVRSPLGWFIQGGKSTENGASIMNYVNVNAIGPLEEFIGLETVGLEPKKCKCMADLADKSAISAMEQSVTQRQDGSYEVQLPWKKSPSELPDNFDYAVRRLTSLEKQFKDRPQEWKIYCEQMDDQLSRGVSRHVTQEELANDRKAGKKMWFLPHFAVKKDSTTTPVRVVYDGKSRFQGHCLNDYLAKGENLNAELFDVALRFRENEVGVIADIKKMFQAVKIKPDDARFHRYVFRKHPDEPLEVYELTTITFGDKPSPAAAIVALRHVVEQHAPDDKNLKKLVSEQFYVDDLSESVIDVSDALELKKNLTKTLESGKFSIRKWQSNKKEVCDSDVDPSTATVLGTKWKLLTDTLTVKTVRPLDERVLTKRKILAHTASYYDVFGMLSGLLIRPKMLLQKLWMLNVDWDTPLGDRPDICSMYKRISSDLEEASSVEIPRCLIPERYRTKRPLPEVSLHGFSDASEDAMGMGVWLRWVESPEAEAELTFVAARARLTPLKQSSMPRKELQAILLLSRLMVSLKNALRFSITYSKIWTDSMIAISWLRGQSRSFRSYVAYRVGEITTDFDPHNDIAHVPSDLNGADLISRGGTASEMKEVIEGPEFLKQPPECWPTTPVSVSERENNEEKRKKHIRNSKRVLANVITTPSQPMLDAKRYSSWAKLKMITARVMSLKELPKNQWLKQLPSQITKWPSQRSLREAELYWIRQAQQEINFEDANILKLSPFLDEDGIYRVGGRLGRAPISYDIRHPYLLPKKAYISHLVMQEYHILALHGGHLRTAAEVRKRFWIVGDMTLARRIVRNCVTCRRHRGRPIEQRMADLPEFRVTPCSPPFKTTLVDYLGPVNVKLNRNTTTKGYCALFTCAVTRAVHLTVVQDLSTSAFLQALERFVSIRGAPAVIISDNATCFRGADNKINELNLKIGQQEVRDSCRRYNTQWKFGPPGGPHHQGAVERLVQEVKKAMRHLVKADRLSFVEWETIFCQISGLINSRPVTAMSSSPLDHPPLTPNHFLIGRGDLRSPDIPYDDYKGDLRKRRELCNSMVEGFWRRWMDCIRTLSPRHKCQQSSENLGEGDVVLIVGEHKLRGQWKMGEVVRGYPGPDGLVRIVDVKSPDGTVTKKPVTKLILLMKSSERDDLK